MINEKLQEFTASVTARGRITFGDVRRLDRDCLPNGIATYEEAEVLIAINATLVCADKAWAQWLIARLADWVAVHQEAAASIADRVKSWLDGTHSASAAWTKPGRRIARMVRRELTMRLGTASATSSLPPPSADVRTDHTEPTPRTRKLQPIVQSEILVRAANRNCRGLRRTPTPSAAFSFDIWPAGVVDRHLRYRLDRPYI